MLTYICKATGLGCAAMSATSSSQVLVLARRKAVRVWRTHSEVEPSYICQVIDEMLEWYETSYAVLAPSARRDVAVFSRLNLDLSSDFFFTPRLCELSPELPLKYLARRCAPPLRREGTALLVGDIGAVR